MTDNGKTRDIIHEMADVLRILGNDYTLTSVECEPGDSAARVIKRNSEKTMYIIAYSDPADTEMHLYDENDSLITYRVFYNGSLNESTPEDIADYIIRSF